MKSTSFGVSNSCSSLHALPVVPWAITLSVWCWCHHWEDEQSVLMGHGGGESTTAHGTPLGVMAPAQATSAVLIIALIVRCL
jgi:hypothetical protein